MDFKPDMGIPFRVRTQPLADSDRAVSGIIQVFPTKTAPSTLPKAQ